MQILLPRTSYRISRTSVALSSPWFPGFWLLPFGSCLSALPRAWRYTISYAPPLSLSCGVSVSSVSSPPQTDAPARLDLSHYYMRFSYYPVEEGERRYFFFQYFFLSLYLSCFFLVLWRVCYYARFACVAWCTSHTASEEAAPVLLEREELDLSSRFLPYSQAWSFIASSFRSFPSST